MKGTGVAQSEHQQEEELNGQFKDKFNKNEHS